MHVGHIIETYGDRMVGWDMEKVLAVFTLGLDAIQGELHTRETELAAEPVLA